MKQLMGVLLAITLMAPTGSADAAKYRSVSESEWDVSLDLQPHGSAVYERSCWLADDPDRVVSRRKLSGRWTRQAASVTVTLKSGERLNYTMLDCLPYADFGEDGCSAGLSPVSSSTSSVPGIDDVLLWDVSMFAPPSH